MVDSHSSGLYDGLISVGYVNGKPVGELLAGLTGWKADGWKGTCGDYGEGDGVGIIKDCLSIGQSCVWSGPDWYK